MAVGYKPTSTFAANYADNLCRWDGHSAPHYEVWFLTLNHRASERGFWFRYAIESPSGSGQKPRAALWAATFRRKRPDQTFGLKREFAIEQFAFEGREQFCLRVGDGVFTSSNAAGSVQRDGHAIEWDLKFVPNQKTHHHITRALAAVARPSSSVCSPNLAARFSGVITIDGRKVILDDEPGCQSHLWGRKHVNEWLWVHSNAFESHPDTVFEGLAARPRRAGLTLPPIYSLFLRHNGEQHHFFRLR